MAKIVRKTYNLKELGDTRPTRQNVAMYLSRICYNVSLPMALSLLSEIKDIEFKNSSFADTTREFALMQLQHGVAKHLSIEKEMYEIEMFSEPYVCKYCGVFADEEYIKCPNCAQLFTYEKTSNS